MSNQLSEQELLRRQKLNDMRQLGIDPFPAALFPISHTSIEAASKYSANQESEEMKQVTFAGRIMSVRDMGKACFVLLQDSVGKLQVYVRRDDICPEEDKTLYDTVFKKLIDILSFEFWQQEMSIHTYMKSFFKVYAVPDFILEGWIEGIEFKNSLILIHKSSMPTHNKRGENIIRGTEMNIYKLR
jgi:hypothetical protein